MAENYKMLYEQMKKIVTTYQDEVVPGLRKIIEDLEKNQITVRCKDCDWYRQNEDICVNPKCGKSWYGCIVPPDHYCSYGERKDDGN